MQAYAIAHRHQHAHKEYVYKFRRHKNKGTGKNKQKSTEIGTISLTQKAGYCNCTRECATNLKKDFCRALSTHEKVGRRKRVLKEPHKCKHTRLPTDISMHIKNTFINFAGTKTKARVRTNKRAQKLVLSR